MWIAITVGGARGWAAALVRWLARVSVWRRRDWTGMLQGAAASGLGSAVCAFCDHLDSRLCTPGGRRWAPRPIWPGAGVAVQCWSRGREVSPGAGLQVGASTAGCPPVPLAPAARRLPYARAVPATHRPTAARHQRTQGPTGGGYPFKHLLSPKA